MGEEMAAGRVEGVVASIQPLRKNRLSLVEVVYGTDAARCQVVVARSDVAIGMRAVLALDGAELEDGRTVRKKKVAGEWTEGELLELHSAQRDEDLAPAIAPRSASTSAAAAASPGRAEGCEAHRDGEGGKGESSGPELRPTDLRVSFCQDPRQIGCEFTPTYDRSPPRNFASVNAGDPNFKVLPGKTLNGQFGLDLRDTAYHYVECYQPFHESLFSGAQSGRLVEASSEVLLLNPNLAAGFVRKLSDDDRTGVAFVEVFRPEMCVHGNQRNAAMVYAVGPRRKRYPSDRGFLVAVEATAENIGRACSEYNLTVASARGLPKIELLRVPMISGGVFGGDCPRADIAAAIIKGLEAANSQDSPELNFAYCNAFREAWDEMRRLVC